MLVSRSLGNRPAEAGALATRSAGEAAVRRGASTRIDMQSQRGKEPTDEVVSRTVGPFGQYSEAVSKFVAEAVPPGYDWRTGSEPFLLSKFKN